jgi:hypothetical protein
MANTVSVAFASQDLTLTANLTNAQTITIGGKAYTTQTSLTDSDGNVLIGGTAEATIDNLVAGINRGAGAGTVYAASMTRNAHVYAVKVSATVLRVYAAVPGAIGNNVAVSETQTNASWGAANLAGGTGNVLQFIETLIAMNQINSEVLFELKKLTAAGD